MTARLLGWIDALPIAGSAYRAIWRRRKEARAVLERIPLVGDLAVAAYRAGRKAAKGAAAPQVRPERFMALYAARNGVADVDAITDPVKKMHAQFALSTVERGRHAVDRIAGHAPIRGKRCLDVGCAYGGFLVGYHSAGAREVVGIDINARLLDYARALLLDYAVDARVLELDVLSRDGVGDLGRFDVVTCNDVIEHVLDPKVALEHLAALLERDGVLYMEIPNRHSARFVRADGHFQKFGITALPKRRADAYFAQSNPGATNDVTYRSLAFYLHHLARAGLRPELLDVVAYAPDRQLPEIQRTFAECLDAAARPIPGVDEEMRRAVERRVRRLARAFEGAYARYQRLVATNPDQAKALGQKLVRAYGEDFWVVLARRR